MESDSVLGQIFACANLRFFLLRVVVVVISKRCRLHVLSRKSNWESLVRQSQLLASTSIGSCSQLLPNIFLKKMIERCEQGSNLWEIPIGFQVQRLNHSAIIALLFVSLSCLRVQVLVRVPNFSRISFWKKFERCEQGSNLCGKFPLDFKSNALTTRPS